MSVFNRVLSIALLIVMIVSGFVLAGIPDVLLATIQEWTGEAVVTAQDRIASAIVGAAMIIVAGLILYWEFHTEPRRTVVIAKMNDGTAAIELDSIAQHIRQQLEAIDGVRLAQPSVTSRGSSIAIRVVVVVAQEVDVPAKAAEIGEVVRHATEKMGVALSKQRINLRHEAAGTKAPQRA